MTDARYAVYLLLGQDGPVEPAVRAAALDRMCAGELRKAAEVASRTARGCGDNEVGQYAASVAAGIGRELRRLADELEAHARKAEPLPELTVFRASYESMTLGLYTTREAARKHCQTLVERASVATLEWRPGGEWRENDDGEPGPDEAEELYEYGTHPETATWDPTGYVVTPLTVASAYDEEADE